MWSVTHFDVMAALGGNPDCDLESPLVAMRRHDGSIAPASLPRAQEKAFTQDSVARLLLWLASNPDRAGADAALDGLQRNAAWLSFLMGPSTQEDKVICDQQMGQWLHRLPDYIREPGVGFAPVMSGPNRAALQVGWWPLVLAKGLSASNSWTAPGAVLLSESRADDEEDLHREWRRWLQLYNACQILPGMLLTTATGLDGHDYDDLGIGSPGMPVPAQPAMSGAWQEVMDLAQPPMRPGLAALAKAGAPVPEVETELADDKGRVVADAELTWGEARVVLLRPDQSDLAEIWHAQNWVVCQLDGSLTLIESGPWAAIVASILGLKNDEVML